MNKQKAAGKQPRANAESGTSSRKKKDPKAVTATRTARRPVMEVEEDEEDGNEPPFDGNEINVEAALANKPILELREAARLAALAAFKGYAKVRLVGELLDVQLIFGEDNPRPIDPTALTKLKESMNSGILRNFTDEGAIPLLLTGDQCQFRLLAKTVDNKDNIPELPLTQIGCSLNGITASGGQHRQLAASEVYSNWISQDTRLTAQKSDIEELDDKTDADKLELAEIVTRLKDVWEKLASMKYWLVKVYDKDQLDFQSRMYLATNEQGSTHGETHEEWTMIRFKHLIHEKYHGDPISYKKLLSLTVTLASYKTDSHLKKLFKRKHTVDFLSNVLTFGRHFGGSEIGKFKWQKANLFGVHGGILSEMSMYFYDQLVFLFSPGPTYPTQQQLDILMQAMLEKPGDIFLVERWKAEYHLPANVGLPCIEMITTTLLYELDGAFIALLHNIKEGAKLDEYEQATYFIGTREPVFTAHWNTYKEAVINILLTNVVGQQWTTEDQHNVQRNIIVKTLILLNKNMIGDIIYPLFTRSLILYIAKGLATVPDAIKEVARWFDALIDHTIMAGRKTSTCDYSASLNVSLLKDPNFSTSSHCLEAPRLVAFAIWEEAAYSLLGMQSQLNLTPSLNIARPKQSEVDGLFKGPTDETLAISKATSSTSYLKTYSGILAALPISRGEVILTLIDAYINSFGPKKLPSGPSTHPKEYQLMLHSSFVYSSFDENNIKAEIQKKVRCSFIEMAIVKQYRQTLLDSHAGPLRRKLLTLLSPLSHSKLRGAITSPTYVFWDGLVPESSSVVAPRSSIKKLLFDLKSSVVDAKASKLVIDLITGIERCPAAHLATNTTLPLMAPEVAVWVDGLLKSLLVNQDRQKFRSAYGLEAEFRWGKSKGTVDIPRLRRSKDPNTVLEDEEDGADDLDQETTMKANAKAKQPDPDSVTPMEDETDQTRTTETGKQPSIGPEMPKKGSQAKNKGKGKRLNLDPNLPMDVGDVNTSTGTRFKPDARAVVKTTGRPTRRPKSKGAPEAANNTADVSDQPSAIPEKRTPEFISTNLPPDSDVLPFSSLGKYSPFTSSKSSTRTSSPFKADSNTPDRDAPSPPLSMPRSEDTRGAAVSDEDSEDEEEEMESDSHKKKSKRGRMGLFDDVEDDADGMIVDDSEFVRRSPRVRKTVAKASTSYATSSKSSKVARVRAKRAHASPGNSPPAKKWQEGNDDGSSLGLDDFA